MKTKHQKTSKMALVLYFMAFSLADISTQAEKLYDRTLMWYWFWGFIIFFKLCDKKWHNKNTWKQDSSMIHRFVVLFFLCQEHNSWSRGSVPSSHARGQQFEPRRRQYFKLLLDPGDFHSNPSGLLSFNKSETVLWTTAKYYYYYYFVQHETLQMWRLY